MVLSERDIAHFKRGGVENPLFWSRFGSQPNLKGASVLDVGCGWGSLCVDMASSGTKQVVGLDIKPELIDFANENLRRAYPQLADIVVFACVDLRDWNNGPMFDYIVSKDAFEHIIDLRDMLEAMKKHLKSGGRIYAGFGPIYTRPYGDHDRRRMAFKPWGRWGRFLARIPWGHMFMEPLIINMRNRYRGEKNKSMYDLGLNKMAPSDYRRDFRASGLSIVDLRVSQSTKFQSRVFSLLKRIPFLEDYCTHNIYCILEKE